MIWAFLVNEAGQTEQRVSAPALRFLDASAYGEDKSFVVFDEALGSIEDFETTAEGDGIAVVPRTIDPGEALAYAKIALREKVKALRNTVEWRGCATSFGHIDSDPDSQRKLSGGSTAALALGEAFSKEWRMADDTVVTFDAAQMIEAGLTVVAHVDACQQRKNALDEEIDAATTLAELEVIDIEAGWPGE